MSKEKLNSRIDILYRDIKQGKYNCGFLKIKIDDKGLVVNATHEKYIKIDNTVQEK